MFTGNTDPFPFLAAAYGIGFIGFSTVYIAIVYQRYALRKAQQVLNHDEQTHQDKRAKYVTSE